MCFWDHSSVPLGPLLLAAASVSALLLHHKPARALPVDLPVASTRPPEESCRVYVRTFGCSHNASDSEYMAGQLAAAGYRMAASAEEADVVVVNSCTVKGPSEASAWTEAQKAKQQGKQVVVTGCVPQSDRKFAENSEFSVLGVEQLERIVETVEETRKGHVVKILEKNTKMCNLTLPKIRKNKFVEIIPISLGCLGSCTYCKTKFARGDLRSYPVEAILGRIRQAAKEGVSEVWLTSEDSGAYGIDIETNIVELLERILHVIQQECPRVMVRLGMTNPPYIMQHVKKLVDILNHPNVFAFIHIPVQSGSDRVLRTMKREYTRAEFDLLVETLKEGVKDITIATDLIAAFPGETDDDHKLSRELVEITKFSVLNISQFYSRPGTVAAKMKKTDSVTARARTRELTNVFESYNNNASFPLHTVCNVWFSELDNSRNQTVGHTKNYVKVVVDGLFPEVLGCKRPASVLATSKWHLKAALL